MDDFLELLSLERGTLWLWQVTFYNPGLPQAIPDCSGDHGRLRRLFMKFRMCALSSFDISRNWFPSSYISLEGNFLIHATFEIAFIGFGDAGMFISTTRRQASEINLFDSKQTPPSLMFRVNEPAGTSPNVRKFLYLRGRADSNLWYLRFSMALKLSTLDTLLL